MIIGSAPRVSYWLQLARAPGTKSQDTKVLLRGVELLVEPSGLSDVVAYYLEHRLMPAEAGGDAFHLAMASMHTVDFLLTWNCQHLANANKAALKNDVDTPTIARSMGYTVS